MQVSGRSQNLAIIMLAEAYGRHRCQTLSLKKGGLRKQSGAFNSVTMSCVLPLSPHRRMQSVI